MHEKLARAFADAGVSYVFLHGHTGASAEDSDIDIAVDRKSFRTLDAILRSGKIGRLLQTFNYDIPWCWGYILEIAPGCQQPIDVVCDPWGISFYGIGTNVAEATATTVDGLSVPSPAAAVLYLCVKRAIKGDLPHNRAALLAAFKKDPSTAKAVLESHLGEAGRDIARTLATGTEDVHSDLRNVRSTIRAKQRTPSRMALKIFFGLLRSARRVTKPTGFVVSLAGPDGTGKSTLANDLAMFNQQVFGNLSSSTEGRASFQHLLSFCEDRPGI